MAQLCRQFRHVRCDCGPRQAGGGYAATLSQPIISRAPDVMGGAAVFHGTRVPIQTLLDYLEAGESIDGFLAGLPSVTREQVIAFLEEAKDRMVESVS